MASIFNFHTFVRVIDDYWLYNTEFIRVQNSKRNSARFSQLQCKCNLSFREVITQGIKIKIQKTATLIPNCMLLSETYRLSSIKVYIQRRNAIQVGIHCTTQNTLTKKNPLKINIFNYLYFYYCELHNIASMGVYMFFENRFHFCTRLTFVVKY